MSKENAPQFIPKRIVPTREQTAIQTAQQRIVLIDANAGAAKTTTLALRLAEALYRGRKPESMLALVFTQAARQALKLRLAEIGLQTGAIARLTIATFDDFARQILLKLEGSAPPFIATDEALRPYALMALENVAQKYAERYQLDISTTNTALAQFLKLQLRTKARLDLHSAAFGQNELEDSLDALGMSLTNYLWLREYERLRGSDCGEIAFRAPFDATYDLVCMLEDDAPLRQQLPAFQIIVADELHDLNEASFRLLTMLIARDKAYFCGAGDKDQVIYTWSGADHRFLAERFSQHFPSLQRYRLSYSYRYGAELAQAAGALKRKTSASALSTATEIILLPYDFGTPDACEEQLLASLKQWQKAGNSLGTTAILLRDRDQSIRVENALFKNDIGYTLVDMSSYLSTPEILMLRGMVAIAQKDLDSIKSTQRRADILEALIVFAEIPFSREQLRQAKDDVAHHPELLEGFLSNQLGKSVNQDKASLTLAAVAYLRQLDGAAQAGAALQHVIDVMQLEPTVRRIYVDPAQARVVTKSIHSFITVCHEAAIDLAGFSAWLGGMEDALADTKKQHKVTLACIDHIKGLEYAHVILPYLASDEFPRAKADALEEENRFYVAITRAKQRLTLLMPRQLEYRSRFIAALQAT